jgi:23S rRNA pseudouridine2605 synthase
VSQPMNLVVFLARSGVGSRRTCDELVRDGAVTVNGEVVTFPRQKIGEEDVVAVNGEPVEPRELRYLLVNKPRGVASTRRDPHAERVIVDLVPNGRMLFPVGRLDVDTTGLIVLTNDGVLANRLMHPRYGVPKTYAVRVRGKVSRRALASLRQGVELEDGLTAPAEVNLKKQSAKTALVEITIHEGRKRQVRRMFASVGLPVEELHRRRYGPIADKGLEPGGYRELAGDEVEALRRAGEEVAEAVGGEQEGPPVLLAGEPAPGRGAPEPTLAPTGQVEAAEPMAPREAEQPPPAPVPEAAQPAQSGPDEPAEADGGETGDAPEAGAAAPDDSPEAEGEELPDDLGEPGEPEPDVPADRTVVMADDSPEAEGPAGEAGPGPDEGESGG